MFFLFHTKVYAKNIDYTFKVGQNVSINSPYSKPQDNFEYILEPISKDAPLPEAKNKTYNFSLKADEEKQINIEYQKPGEYKYKLYQNKTYIKNVTQDKEVYTLFIKIIKKDGQLVKDEIMIINSSNKKVEEMNFHNIYKITSQEKAKNKKKISAVVATGIKENFILLILIILVARRLFILINNSRDKEKV
ncbi:MAG: FctA domain-containing protein [Anaerococcus sp.]|nr:FctA domain-containing protein [Anaerococcus sp.]